MNTILEHITEQRKGHYCHAIEASSVYELEEAICAILDEGWNKEEVEDFFTTMSIYYLPQEGEEEDAREEEAIYNFNLSEFINTL